MTDPSHLSCPPANFGGVDSILLAHGEGGSLMRRLLNEHILPRLGISPDEPLHDAAVLPILNGQPVLSADAFVVSPLFFPGGNIGTLAVYGTVNDLVVRGAKPLWLTLTMVLEEGLPLAILDDVLESIAGAARECEVGIVAGDTKVVPRGAADGMFLSTSGVGQLLEPAPSGAKRLKVGDVLIVSGPVGQHGIAILAAREELEFDPLPQSDCRPLIEAVAALRAAGICPIALRDATRGGVAAVLHEWAHDCGQTLLLEEQHVPVSAEVRGVCELLGIDPLFVANEGTMVIAVRPEQERAALSALRSQVTTHLAARIGKVREPGIVPVIVRRSTGTEQPLIETAGAPLPRIC